MSDNIPNDGIHLFLFSVLFENRNIFPWISLSVDGRIIKMTLKIQTPFFGTVAETQFFIHLQTHCEPIIETYSIFFHTVVVRIGIQSLDLEVRNFVEICNANA